MTTSAETTTKTTMVGGVESCIEMIQNDIIGTDAGDRGMKPLIVPGDLYKASKLLVDIISNSDKSKSISSPLAVLLSGFPCCVNENPPTETDGPPGTYAIARALLVLGYKVIIVTDQCNYDVFNAALTDLSLPNSVDRSNLTLEAIAPDTTITENEKQRLIELGQLANVIIACERAGMNKNGICCTMRGINMNAKGLIAPLHIIVENKDSSNNNTPFIAIGDGGNELGMGKVLQNIIHNPKIAKGDEIACVVSADYLIAASVSNWGGYALAACTAIVKKASSTSTSTKDVIDQCLPSDQNEIELLNRCVQVGCRDGVSGKVEATVDGMPLETSLQCLRDIRTAAIHNC